MGSAVDFFLIVAMVVIGLALVALRQEHQRHRERAAALTQNVASLMGESLANAFDKADAIVQATLELYLQSAEEMREHGDASAHLRQVAHLAPEATAIRIVDENGVLRFASDPLPAQPVSYAHHTFFTRLRDDPSIGRLVAGPIPDPMTQQAGLVLARRITDHAGRFKGVIYAYFLTTQFNQFYAALALDPSSTVTIRTLDLALVHRYPDVPGNVLNQPVSQEMHDAIRVTPRAGRYLATSTLDGIERSYAYQQVRGVPLYIVVGTPTGFDYMAIGPQAILLVLIAVLAIVLAGAMVYSGVRNERRLREQIVSRKLANEALQAQVQERAVAEAQSRAAHRYARSVIEASLDPLVTVNEAGRITDLNQAMEGLAGMRQSQLIGTSLADLFTQPPALRQAIRQAYNDGHIRNIHLQIRRAGGSVRDVVVSANTVPELHQHSDALVVTVHDITAHKRLEQDLRISAAAFESHDGMLITDEHMTILRVNRAFTAITGYSSAEAVGQTPRLLKSGHHAPEFYADMFAHIEKNGSWSGEIWNRRKNGDVYPEWLTITAVKDAQDKTTHYVASLSDITYRKEAEERIQNLAYYDSLTRLPNRLMLLDRLKQAQGATQRSHHHGALLFIDLDNFKVINDTLGHDQGDLLLQEIAQRLVQTVRETDTVARLGGDEFVVMLTDLAQDAAEAANEAQLVAEKIRVTVSAPYQLRGTESHSTPSVGVTLFTGHTPSMEELLRQADLAMYQAKDGGRNAIRFFDVDMDTRLNRRIELERDLRLAIEREQLELHFQPQVREPLGAIGVEALVRWRHPTRGLVAPGGFIAVAEESGLILPMGQWVLQAACHQLATWATDPTRDKLSVAVNVSARQIHEPSFVTQVRDILAQTGANPRRLKLELTESVLISDIEGIAAKMNELQRDGIRFSLDDFGTGFSSLSYLKRLPLNQLKIDASFVRDILVDPSDEAIAKMVISLGASLGLEVIAEGVETSAQKVKLEDLGCTQFQGYLYGRPVPVAQLEEWLDLFANAQRTAQDWVV